MLEAVEDHAAEFAFTVAGYSITFSGSLLPEPNSVQHGFLLAHVERRGENKLPQVSVKFEVDQPSPRS